MTTSSEDLRSANSEMLSALRSIGHARLEEVANIYSSIQNASRWSYLEIALTLRLVNMLVSMLDRRSQPLLNCMQVGTDILRADS